jgi:hypothetical protein
MEREARAITTPFWDALLTGGLSLVGMTLVLAAMFLFGARVTVSKSDWITLSILINATHFMASYRLLYVSRAQVLANRWSTLYVPAALLVVLVVGATTPLRAFLFDQLLVGSAIYLAWHYTGQAWGMVASFGHATGVGFTPREGSMIRFGMRTLLVLHILITTSGWFPPERWIPTATYVRIYGTSFYAVCAVAAVSLGVGAMGFRSARRRVGRLPIRVVLPWAALYLWYPFWYLVPGGFLFVQLSHALQYLAFPLRVEVNRYASAAPRSAQQRRMRALLAYVGLVLAGSVVLFGPILATRWLGPGWYSTPSVREVFAAFTNCVAIHHYFIDGAVWKLSNPTVRRELFSHLGNEGTKESDRER